jgi:hypothetical protein
MFELRVNSTIDNLKCQWFDQENGDKLFRQKPAQYPTKSTSIDQTREITESTLENLITCKASAEVGSFLADLRKKRLSS